MTLPQRYVIRRTSVVAWHSGSAMVSVNQVNLRRVRLVLVWATVSAHSIPDAGHIISYATNNPGQLSLAIPSWVGE